MCIKEGQSKAKQDGNLCLTTIWEEDMRNSCLRAMVVATAVGAMCIKAKQSRVKQSKARWKTPSQKHKKQLSEGNSGGNRSWWRHRHLLSPLTGPLRSIESVHRRYIDIFWISPCERLFGGQKRNHMHCHNWLFYYWGCWYLSSIFLTSNSP